jgi:hypothetical protein
MKPKGFQQGTAVKVYWHDSASAQGWQYTSKVGQVGFIVSIGFVVNCKKDCITITTSFSSDGASIDPLSIPWGAIAKVEDLGKKNSRNGGVIKAAA